MAYSTEAECDLSTHVNTWILSAIKAWRDDTQEGDADDQSIGKGLELEMRIGKVYSKFESEGNVQAAYIANEQSARMYYNNKVHACIVNAEAGAVSERFESGVGAKDCMDEMIESLVTKKFVKSCDYRSITIGQIDDGNGRLVYDEKGDVKEYYLERKTQLSPVVNIATPLYAYDMRLATNKEVIEEHFTPEKYNELVAGIKEMRGTGYEARLRKRQVYRNDDMKEWEVHCTHVKVYNSQRKVISHEFEVEIEMTSDGTAKLSDEHTAVIEEYTNHLLYIVKDVLLASTVPTKILPYRTVGNASKPIYGISEPLHPSLSSIPNDPTTDTILELRRLCHGHVVYPRSNTGILRRSDLHAMDKSSYVVWNTPVGMPALLLRFQTNEGYEIRIITRDQKVWGRDDLDGNAHTFFKQFGSTVMDVDIVWNPIKRRMMIVINDVYVLTDVEGKSVQITDCRNQSAEFCICDFNDRIAYVKDKLQENDKLEKLCMMPIITVNHGLMKNIRDVATAYRDGWHALPITEEGNMDDVVKTSMASAWHTYMISGYTLRSPQYSESMAPLRMFQYMEPTKIPVYLTVSLNTSRVTCVSEIGNKREDMSSECKRLSSKEIEYLKRLQLPSDNRVVCQYTYNDGWIPQISQQAVGCPNATTGAEFRRVTLALQDHFTEHELILILSSRCESSSYKAVSDYKTRRSSILSGLLS